MNTDDFDYWLPESFIAQQPADPRDSSRLLDTRTMSDHRFRDLPTLLEPGDLVVVNTTRVRAARLGAIRADTGGNVEVLILRAVDGARWEALVRPARRIRPGIELTAGDLRIDVLTAPERGRVLVEMRTSSGASADVEQSIEAAGSVPLPPYITAEGVDPSRYQTVFADRLGSAAAPTAGLHFTEGTLDDLAAAGVARAAVELEVGLATFRPITADRIEDHVMHGERITVSARTVEAVAATQERGGRVVAVGTTVVRALETAAAAGELAPFEGDTELYIRPGYRFAVVDLLVTNFHAPRSSLLVMLAAFMGDHWRTVYDTARDRTYRFLSFGDAMLVERRSS